MVQRRCELPCLTFMSCVRRLHSLMPSVPDLHLSAGAEVEDRHIKGGCLGMMMKSCGNAGCILLLP